MKKAVKLFIVIGIILGFPLILPLIVGIIALKKLDTATCKDDIKITAILTLLFCNIFSSGNLLPYFYNFLCKFWGTQTDFTGKSEKKQLYLKRNYPLFCK